MCANSSLPSGPVKSALPSYDPFTPRPNDHGSVTVFCADAVVTEAPATAAAQIRRDSSFIENLFENWERRTDLKQCMRQRRRRASMCNGAAIGSVIGGLTTGRRH